MTADRAALAEKVARLLCEQRGQHPDGDFYWLRRDGSHEKVCRWMNYTKDATAAIDLIRAEVLEEAARAVLEHSNTRGKSLTNYAALLASAIRALKDK